MPADTYSAGSPRARDARPFPTQLSPRQNNSQIYVIHTDTGRQTQVHTHLLRDVFSIV